MYSFEGDFKRIPAQSLRGSSQRNNKDSLIAQSRQKREARERLKKQDLASKCIQSVFRSWRERQKQKGLCRNDFDVCLIRLHGDTTADPSKDLATGLRLITFFFDAKIDVQRLASFAQLLVKKKDEVKKIIRRDNQTHYSLSKCITSCSGHLSSISSSENPASFLRVLEVFTSVQFWESSGFPEALGLLLARITSQGYFTDVLQLCERRVPEVLALSRFPPTPLAGSLLQLFAHPLVYFHSGQISYKHSCMISEAFLRTLSHFSNHLHLFMVPALIAMPEGLSLGPIIDVLTESSGTNGKLRTIERSPSLLYSVCFMAAKYLHSLPPHQTLLYLRFLSADLPSEWIAMTTAHGEDWSAENDEVTPSSSQRGEYKLRPAFLKFINSSLHVTALVKAISPPPGLPSLDRQGKGALQRPVPSPWIPNESVLPWRQCLQSVMTLCHNLLYKMEVKVHLCRLLYSIAFNKVLMQALWEEVWSFADEMSGPRSFYKIALALGSRGAAERTAIFIPLVCTFCLLCHHSLQSLHDPDFFMDTGMSGSSPCMFTLKELSSISLCLKYVCTGAVEACLPDVKPIIQGEALSFLREEGGAEAPPTKQQYQTKWLEWGYLFKVAAQLVRHLYERDSRRSFCSEGHWISNNFPISSSTQSSQLYGDPSVFEMNPLADSQFLFSGYTLEATGIFLSPRDSRTLVILLELPFVIPFDDRLKIFHNLVYRDQTSDDRGMPAVGPPVRVRRNYLYDDAFERLSQESLPDIRPRIRVELVNQAGALEAGIDGGGVFREFLEDLLRTGFDANRGLFKATSDQLIHPNPDAADLVENYTQHFYFLGRLVGKALYERMLVEIPFADFFLTKILTKSEGVDFQHLASMDPELYRQLVSLKTGSVDIGELGLDFTVSRSVAGVTKHVELKPGGSDIAVTKDNYIEYIHLMANYKLNRQIRQHMQAFQSGLSNVISLGWLRVFNAQEFQMLISGAHVSIDIEDLQAHTNYSGGYTANSPTILYFWEVVSEFDDQQKRQLLRFVTSCSRQPLLGFKDLYPVFCIHYGGMEDRLPSASTCMNLLKLPEFPTLELLRDRLVCAIQSGAGFELS